MALVLGKIEVALSLQLEEFFFFWAGGVLLIWDECVRAG